MNNSYSAIVILVSMIFFYAITGSVLDLDHKWRPDVGLRNPYMIQYPTINH